MIQTEGASPVETAWALRRMRGLIGELERIDAEKRSGGLTYAESVDRSLRALDGTGLDSRRCMRPMMKRIRLALGNGWIGDGIRRIREYWPDLALPAEQTGELDYDDSQVGRAGRPRRRRPKEDTVGMRVG